jgi:outer membrane PBP1 activator LpoA protein
MKRRLTPILTISIGIILVASIAYAAADKEKRIKQVNQPTDPNHEEAMLMRELIQSVDDQEKKAPVIVKAEKVLVQKTDRSQDLLDLSN